MESEYKLSILTTLFMVKLRNLLIKNNITIQIFFKAFKLTQSNYIGKIDFQKIIHMVNPELNTFQRADLFKQMAVDDVIPIQRFFQIYQICTKNVPIKSPSHQSKANDSAFTQKSSQQQTKKQVKAGVKKLYQYIKNLSDPQQLFNQCDLSQSGSLCKKEFNKLLISADIQQFKSKRNRKYFIDYLYKNYTNDNMTKDNFYHFFKIDKKNLLKNSDPDLINYYHLNNKNKNHSVQQKKNIQFNSNTQKNQKNTSKEKIIKPPQIYIPKDIPRNMPQEIPKNIPKDIPKNNTLLNDKNLLKPDQNVNAPMKKKKQPQYAEINSQKNVAVSRIHDDNYGQNDIQLLFPNAYSFYRQGIPQNQQMLALDKLQKCIKENKIYRDSSNPISHLGTYTSAQDFFNGSYSLFQMAASVIHRQKSRIGIARSIQPKDIIQGQIGDCYFLSSIASLVSLYPELISQRLLFNYNPSRFYAVRLFIDGEWIVFQTDDHFPCKYGKPCFAKPHGKQIWVMLLEKCWAKAFGSYLNIQSGTPTEGFLALTGAPCQYISAKDTQEQKQKILIAFQQSYKRKFVTTASGNDKLNNMSKQKQTQIGLIGNHAYSFLKMFKVNNQTVLKMRNPWGKQVWLGRWSYNSKQWTSELRIKYNYVKPSDDGTFYIPWDEFIKYFGNFVICKLDPTFTHSTRRMSNHKRKSNYFEFQIKQSGNYNISIYQQSKRKFNFDKNYQFSGARIILLKKNGPKSFQYIGSKNKSAYGCTLQSKLEQGQYILSAKVQWNQYQQHECVLCCYGPQKTYFTSVDRRIAPIFKSQMIESYSTKFPGKTKTYQKIKIPQAFSQTQFNIDTGIGYIRVSNYSNKQFSTTLSMPSMDGIKAIKPHQIPYKFDMKPGKSQIIGFFVSHKGYHYNSSESMEYRP